MIVERSDGTTFLSIIELKELCCRDFLQGWQQFIRNIGHHDELTDNKPHPKDHAKNHAKDLRFAKKRIDFSSLSFSSIGNKQLAAALSAKSSHTLF